MNPELDTTPGLGLPQPFAEARGGVGRAAPEYSQSREMPAPLPGPQPLVPNPGLQQPALSPHHSSPFPVGQASSTVPVVADEPETTSTLGVELINKAREIVERTHADPFAQSHELSLVKAQYIKAEYGKDIKVGDEPS